MRHAYNAWERPAPLYVLLVGDANLDYRDFMGVGNNYVPTMMTENLPTIGEVMTDNAFAQVDGDDPLPDLFVGRIPSRNVAAVELMVNRMIDYSTTPQGSDFGALLVSDDGLGAIEPAFNSLSTAMAEQVPATWNVNEIRATDYADNLSMRNDIRHRLLDGALVTLYVGHGSVEIWGSKNGDQGRFWANTDVGRLPVDTMPTFAVALNCINGYFADFSRESLGEKWLMADGGGIGAWAPSGLGSLLDVELLGPELMQRFFQSEEAELGRATTMALIRAYTLHGIGEDNLEELVLLADPAQRLRLDEVAASAPLTVGDTPRNKSGQARGAREVDGR